MRRESVGLRRFLFSAQGWPYLLTPFIPIAVGFELGHASATLIFICAAAGVVPTAALMGQATEELAARTGPGIGGLLNVSFGNAPEIIIALFALNEGLHEVVKASLIGSILGNVLLVMGAAMLVGGLGRERQRFDPTAAGVQSLMLMLAGAALVMPAVFELVSGSGLPGVDDELVTYHDDVNTISLMVAGVLLSTYVFGLIFSLRTHRALFNPVDEGGGDQHGHGEFGWSVRRSVGLLALAGIAVGLMSEILVGSISEASESIGLSEFFVGLIVVAIVGNAAEHWVALLFAAKDKMDLAVNIAIGSAAQIALFAAPVLVFASLFIGPATMPLVFNGYEIAAVLIAVLVAAQVAQDGESTWFEGVQLLALYAIIGTTVYFA